MPARLPGARLGPLDILVLSAWCGLAAGWLEVGTRVLCQGIHPTGRLYLMSRHFVWLVPLAELVLFTAVGLLLAMAARLSPRGGGWLGPRLLLAIGLMPIFLIAIPQIDGRAWLILASGIAIRLVPWVERTRRPDAAVADPEPSRACWAWYRSWRASSSGPSGSAQWRESGRPLPPAGAPNVLLVVLDTVRADHLSLYGYPRGHQPDPRAAGAAGDPLRRGARDRALDLAVAREPVHRSMAP